MNLFLNSHQLLLAKSNNKKTAIRMRIGKISYAWFLFALKKKIWLTGLFILVVCNIFVWYSCLKMNAGRPIVNIDYTIPIIFIITFRRLWAFSFLFLFGLIDIVASSIPEFKTVGRVLVLEDLLNLWNFLSGDQILFVCLVGMIPCFGVRILLLENKEINSVKFSLLFLAFNALLCVGDLLNGSSSLLTRADLLVDQNIAFSASYRISKRVVTSRNKNNDNSLVRVESALQKYIEKTRFPVRKIYNTDTNSRRYLTQFLTNKKAHKVLFIIAESLGVLKVDPDRSTLFSPLLSLTNKYVFDLGSIQSTGVTIDAEKREYFGVGTRFPTSLNLRRESFVNKFLDSDYELFAFHNYYGAMYDRRQSLVEMGFKNLFFLDDFLIVEPNCESTGVLFRGASDRAMADRVSSALTFEGLNRNRFIYWLTLSGHLPVDLKYSKQVGTPQRYNSKIYQQLPESVFRHELIMAGLINNIYDVVTRGSVFNCDVVIVGDHAPPYGDKANRSFYRENLVPYLIMKSREQDR